HLVCCVLSIISHPPTSTLFPYTTLFRSRSVQSGSPDSRGHRVDLRHRRPHLRLGRVGCPTDQSAVGPGSRIRRTHRETGVRRHRSEEHTSELQSRSDLVCRLLLEKKKTE